MRASRVAAILCLFIGSPLARAAAGNGLPSVELTRNMEATGMVESLVLRCARDLASKDEFVCQVVRVRNGVEVASASMTAREAKSLLGSFFQKLPKARSADTAPRKTAGSPLLNWKIHYRGRSEEGFVWGTGVKTDSVANLTTGAVLALESSLANQLVK